MYSRKSACRYEAEKLKTKYSADEQAWDAKEKSKKQAMTWCNLVKAERSEHIYSRTTT